MKTTFGYSQLKVHNFVVPRVVYLYSGFTVIIINAA